MSPVDLVSELHELIVALDRRVPHVERAGEASIAREAAALRAMAVKRLAELSPARAARLPAVPDVSRRGTNRR